MLMKLSEQQNNYVGELKARKRNILLSAVAGSGKTSTIIYGANQIPGRVAFVAFGRKIADEIKEKTAGRKDTFVNTFHGFGRGAIVKAFPKSRLEENKVYRVMDELKVPEMLKGFVAKTSRLAREYVFGYKTKLDERTQWDQLISHFSLDLELADPKYDLPEDLDALINEGINWSIKVIEAGIKMAPECYDFTDQLNLPLMLRLFMWQYDTVFGDEIQDSNPAKRYMLDKMKNKGGFLNVVGDRSQAIMAFSGADNDAMDLIKQEFNCLEMPLSYSFRCPKKVVEVAQQWNSEILSHPDAIMGEYESLADDKFDMTSLQPNDVMLSRVTRELVSRAHKLMAKGIPCYVEGKDIGKQLIKLAYRWKKVKSLSHMLDKLAEYQEKESEKLIAKKQEAALEALNDRIETLSVLINSLPSNAEIVDLQKKVDELFQDSKDNPKPKIILSTIHKSKGREWKNVYWLGRNIYQPSKYARQDWQKQQERNLMYVAATRSKYKLTEVILSGKNR